MNKEKISYLFCSHCEMPVFPDEECNVWLYLSHEFGLIFCDILCCKEFMKELSYEEVNWIREED